MDETGPTPHRYPGVIRSPLPPVGRRSRRGSGAGTFRNAGRHRHKKARRAAGQKAESVV